MDQLLRTANTRTRLIVSMAVMVLAALLILACGDSSANTGTITNSNTPSTSGSGGSQHFKVGDQVKVGDTWIVTVNSVKTNQGNDIVQPKSGNTFLIIDITLKNVSSQEQTVSSLLQFTLQDSTGQKYDEAITGVGTTPDGKVAANSQLRGQLGYEVPKAQHQFTLAFEADITSQGQTIWDLSV
jgi:hypothetical protein